MRANGSGQSVRVLLDVVQVLDEAEVPYSVIGAMAASIHGVVRASLDADAVLLVTFQELNALKEKFNALGLTGDLRRGDPEDPIPAMLTLQDHYGNRVDLLAGLRGLEKESYSRCVEVLFEGVPLRIAGLEDFIAMKVFAGGPKDLADAEHAISFGLNQLDLGLLRRLALQFGKSAAATCEKLLSLVSPSELP